MTAPAPRQNTFRATLECRYLLLEPEAAADAPLLIVATHGYGMNARVMMELTANLVGREHAILSLAAPNQCYAALEPNSPVSYNWGTSEHWEAAVRLHHEMLLTVLDEGRRLYGIPSSRCLLLGFSQPVGLNYRFAATYPSEIGGVIGICGGVPGDWETGAYQPVSAALLHIAREQDEFYPVEKARAFEARLRLRAGDVEFHMVPGLWRTGWRGSLRRDSDARTGWEDCGQTGYEPGPTGRRPAPHGR